MSKDLNQVQQEILAKGDLDHESKMALQNLTCPSLLETLTIDYKKLSRPEQRQIQNIELINIFRLTRAYRNALILREDPFEALGKDFSKKFNQRVSKIDTVAQNQLLKLKLDMAVDKLLTLPETNTIGIKGKIPKGLFPFLSSKQDIGDQWFRNHVKHVQRLVGIILDHQTLNKNTLMSFIYNNSTLHLLASQPKVFPPQEEETDQQYLYQCCKTFLELGRGLMTNKVKIY